MSDLCDEECQFPPVMVTNNSYHGLIPAKWCTGCAYKILECRCKCSTSQMTRPNHSTILAPILFYAGEEE